MRNFLKVFGVIAIVAVIGFSVIGCEEPDEVDRDLNGTWVGESAELRFNNGTFESGLDGKMFVKGTYTTSGNKITMITTHVHGNIPMIDGLELKWYSKSDLKTVLITEYTDAEIDVLIDMFFTSQTVAYSVSGNILTMTIEYEGETNTLTYTKK